MVLVEPFRPMFAAEIRKKALQNYLYSRWQWHLDQVFVKINGETQYLWRAVYYEGEVLEVLVTKRRDRKAALKFLKKQCNVTVARKTSWQTSFGHTKRR